MEYKCLPSGLHTVKEDLVYFVHGAHAGVSAFLRAESDEQHRNANFVAVGALVPLSYGRLGKSWLLALGLRDLARDAIEDGKDRSTLESYWKEHKLDEDSQIEAPTPSTVRRPSLPAGLERKRKRARSDASTGLGTDRGVASDHPALAISDLLDTFGPLIFPIYRAALLRKRILILGNPPVQRSCNFVYVLSILSGIAQELADVVQPDSEALLRIQTLFNVGIHDIPYLKDRKREERWLACSTDDILGEKKDLWDLLVSLPTSSSSKGRRQWPTIRTPDGTQLKATQRDLRRFRLLRLEIKHNHSQRYHDSPNTEDDDAITPLFRASTTNLLNEVKHTDEGESDVVEPVSWTAMAYNGFMWWASAGEMEAWENEEARADRQLLDEVPEVDDLSRHFGSSADNDNEYARASATATVVTAYFHRLTAAILQPLADVVEDADDETDEGIADSTISVSSEDVRTMGLDTWSSMDRLFVREAMEVYFGREARVEEEGTRVCGVRVC